MLAQDTYLEDRLEVGLVDLNLVHVEVVEHGLDGLRVVDAGIEDELDSPRALAMVPEGLAEPRRVGLQEQTVKLVCLGSRLCPVAVDELDLDVDIREVFRGP